MKNVSPEFTPVDFAVELKKFGGVDGYVDYIFDNSVFTSEEGLDNLMAGREGKELEEVLWNDPAMEFYGMFADVYLDKIAPVIAASDKVLQREYRTYMRGQMAFEPERNFYPDANLTLRVAYGSVEGYEPENGVWHKPFTTLEGIIAKDNPEIYDYDAKYTPGKTELEVPAKISKELENKVIETCKRAYTVLGCGGLSRIDAIIVNDEVYLMEVNTQSGMTDTSDVPAMAKNCGIEFADLALYILGLLK